MIIGHKLEINSLDPTQIFSHASDLALQSRVQAMVVDPDLVVPAKMLLSTLRTHIYKVIAAIDFPLGKRYAVDKVKRCSRDILIADGFEFLMSGGADARVHNEMRFLHEWAREINPTAEIRWVLPLNAPDEVVESVLKHIGKYKPDFLRIDSNLTPAAGVVRYNSGSEGDESNLVGKIREVYSGGLKISGNIDLGVIRRYFDEVDRFDVTQKQAQRIIDEAKPLEGLFTEDEKRPETEQPKSEEGSSTYHSGNAKSEFVVQEDDGDVEADG